MELVSYVIKFGMFSFDLNERCVLPRNEEQKHSACELSEFEGTPLSFLGNVQIVVELVIL
jgi:hypothetical protein